MTELSDAISAVTNLVSGFGLTRDQMSDLLAGPVDGGPHGDGYYPVTAASGPTSLVPSPAKMTALATAAASQGPLQATSRTAMAGFTGQAAGRQAMLTEAGRAGLFEWVTGNQAANVTADPDQALYVPPVATPNGTAGAWRRVVTIGVVFASWAGVVATGAGDQAPAINRLLALPGVSTVILPVGVVATAAPILGRSGKSVVGQGQGLTTVKALPGWAQNGTYPNANSLIYGMPNAIGVRFADLTLDGSKVGNHAINGVNFYANRGFLAERLIVKDVSGYACWAVANTGPAGYQPDGCSGTFRDIWSYNANVHFETTAADNVLFERCHWRDGDGDISCEAGFHPNSGSRNVTYRDCTGIGNPGCGALIANYVAYEIRNIVFDNCTIHVTNAAAAMAIITLAQDGPIHEVSILNSRITSDGYIAAYTSIQASNAPVDGVEFVNCKVDGLQEGLTIGGGTQVAVHGGRMIARSAGANANNYPLLIDPTGGTQVTLDGPILDAKGATLASYPSSSCIKVLGPPYIIGAVSPVPPIGVGHKVSRTLAADQAFVGGTVGVVGAGKDAWNLNGASGGTYRVRAEGTYRGATTATALSLSAQSYGPRRLAGRAQAEATVHDGTPTSAALTTDGAGLSAAPVDVANASRGFRCEFVFVATDDTAAGGLNITAGSAAGGAITIEAGAVMTIEKLS